MEVKITYPLLPLRDIVVFPSMVIPLFVGRDKSITALNEVMKSDKKIVLATQKNSEVDDPTKNDVYTIGCESTILQLLKLPDGTVKVLVEGVKRVKIVDFKDDEKFISCTFEYQKDVITKEEDLFPLALTSIKKLEKLTSINKKISSETLNNIKLLKDPSKIADNIASHLNSTISEKQQIFEILEVKKRLNGIIKIMENEASIIGVEKRIRGRVKTQMEKTQREYYLNEQLKAIGSDLRFDVVITSKNTPDACMRALKSAEHYNLPINRTAFTNGASPYQYTKAFGTSLFLTTNAQDAKEAVNEGVPAAQILPSNQKEQSSQLRVALDGDAVVFGDSSEKISFEKGLEGFYQHEQQNKNTPIEKGPLFPFLYRLSLLKKEFPKEKCPIRIAITTARAAPAAERLIKTLRNWGIEIDELHLLGGMNKGPFLEAFQADIFLDDNIKNAQQGSAHVVSGHVHFGINNQSKA